MVQEDGALLSHPIASLLFGSVPCTCNNTKTHGKYSELTLDANLAVSLLLCLSLTSSIELVDAIREARPESYPLSDARTSGSGGVFPRCPAGSSRNRVHAVPPPGLEAGPNPSYNSKFALSGISQRRLSDRRFFWFQRGRQEGGSWRVCNRCRYNRAVRAEPLFCGPR